MLCKRSRRFFKLSRLINFYSVFSYFPTIAFPASADGRSTARRALKCEAAKWSKSRGKREPKTAPEVMNAPIINTKEANIVGTFWPNCALHQVFSSSISRISRGASVSRRNKQKRRERSASAALKWCPYANSAPSRDSWRAILVLRLNLTQFRNIACNYLRITYFIGEEMENRNSNK